MGGEKLWWTWGMAARGTVPNTSLLVASAGSLWNGSAEQEAYNGTVNATSTFIGNFTEVQRDLVLMILTASFLGLLILSTIIGMYKIITAC